MGTISRQIAIGLLALLWAGISIAAETGSADTQHPPRTQDIYIAQDNGTYRLQTVPVGQDYLHDNSAAALQHSKHPIHQDTQLPRDGERPVLRIGTDRWPPFREINNDQVAGIDDDLWQALSRKLNFKIEYVRCPWKRCLGLMRTGEIDAMSGLAWRHERARFIDFIKPAYFRCSTRFYVRTGDENRLTNEQQLKKLSIGMVRGSVYYPRFDLNQRLNKIGLSQESALLPMLANRRIDTYIGTDCQADFELANSQWYDQLVKAPFDPKHHTPLYIGLSRTTPWHHQAETFSKAIQQLLDNNFERLIRERYYLNVTQPQPSTSIESLQPVGKPSKAADKEDSDRGATQQPASERKP